MTDSVGMGLAVCRTVVAVFAVSAGVAFTWVVEVVVVVVVVVVVAVAVAVADISSSRI